MESKAKQMPIVQAYNAVVDWLPFGVKLVLVLAGICVMCALIELAIDALDNWGAS